MAAVWLGSRGSGESVKVSSLLFAMVASRTRWEPRTVPVLAIGRQYPVRGHMSVTSVQNEAQYLTKKGAVMQNEARTRLDWSGREKSDIVCRSNVYRVPTPGHFGFLAPAPTV